MNTSINGFYPRVSLSFANKVPTGLIAFVRNVVALLTGNVDYPTPMPTLATITDSVDSFETKVHEALNGGKIEIGARNAAQVELLALVRQLATYVQLNCDSDVQKIIETGFEPVKAPSPAGVLPVPKNLRLTLTGVSGQLQLKFDRVTNAANYSVQFATSPDGPWTDQEPSTSATVMIDGLTPGTVYWVRACANGSAGPSGWGGPISAMAV
jgi:hypothetical protein